MTHIAVYPGSFDPPTKGHEDLVRRSLALADRLIVAVAVNVGKQPLFSVEERLEMLRTAVGDDARISFQSFDGLLAEFAKKVGATIIVRGLRAVSDFEYEFQMALMNRQLHPSLETVFLVPAVDLTYLSSSLVREVARFGGDVKPMVHPVVASALARRFRSCAFGPSCSSAPHAARRVWYSVRAAIRGWSRLRNGCGRKA
jgi:pantetheine-phosphate adenylyltransferase